MPTVKRNIGITSEEIVSAKTGELIDVSIQNLSANNIYIGSDQSVETTTGLKLIANVTWSNDKRHEPVWLIADAADSDVRVVYEIYKAGTR